MYNLISDLDGKNGIIVFSDPAGAKACLALASFLNKKNIFIVSNRSYNFLNDFDKITVYFFKKNISEYFELVKPDFVFAGTSFPDKIELNFIEEAKKRDIETYSFVDHWINIRSRFYKGDKYSNHFYLQF